MRYLGVLFLLYCFLSGGSLYAKRVSVIVSQSVVPVLTKKEVNPVLKLELVKRHPEACVVKKIGISLKGTTLPDDIELLSLYKADRNVPPSGWEQCAGSVSPAMQLSLETSLNLTSDTTILWVAVKLKDKIDLSHRIKVDCEFVRTTWGEASITYTRRPVGLRTGVAVRQKGEDGVHTSRIPGIATSQKGTLMSVFDARHDSSRDLQGNIDIGLSRSHDAGATWLPMQVVLDMKRWGNLPEKYNGVSDACILVDEKKGTIYVAGLWMHGVLDGQSGKWVEGMTQDSTRWIHQWVDKGSQPGLGVKETCQFLITQSTDDGRTWATPVNITEQTKRPEWWLFAPAPGHGITLKDGTLVFPTQGRDEEGVPFSNITYSKDGGKTWIASNPAYHNTTECMAVELSDGSIMLNMRDNRNRGRKDVNGRRICVTSDLGKTWTEHPTSRKALIEPTCMASIHRHTYRQNGAEKSILLFCNPESYDSRDRMTLKVSYDDGRSWPDRKKILLDEKRGFGYSCITSVNDSIIGVLYESSQAQIVFQQINLEELIGE